ncbi:hypothetical protein NQ317_000752 [Molorchus minor]|uniref:C3H1-type domain-containing protein n=1 Tax=Molorchus minor TaxID=1323400 RepID=A0ABQ9J7T3_9CUCU|nr:hypothetical protein NQ317_000752 [Molorchus minor]
MSKQIKRKITVNLASKTKTLSKTRPSVFERLGTKANSTNKEYCHHWAQSGSCPYGKGCKYSATHTLISPSKQRAAKSQTATKRHIKDAHKRIRTGAPEDWDQWDPNTLADADPDDLEKRRQELQRELELQMKMENKARKKEKKIKKESSPSTESSNERAHKHKAKNKKLIKPILKDKLKKSGKPTALKATAKSPSPIRVRKKSETPPLKLKQLAPLKKANSPESSQSRDRKASPSKSKGGGSSSSRRDHKISPKDDRRSDKRDDRPRSRGKDRPNDKSRKDKRDSRDRDRDRERERERERRLAREEREAAREKEREEALARCQERQRERERLKELAKKEEERRGRDRNRRSDRGIDKPSGRDDRMLSMSDDRLSVRKGHSTERDRSDRRDRDRHDRTPDSRSTSRKSPDRHDRLDRDLDKDRNYERVYDRSTDRNYDRERDHELDRDYGNLPPRIRDGDRRLDDKDYDSPYDRARHEDRRYLDIEDHYNESSRDDRIMDGRDYTGDRRRRDIWDMRDDRAELERDRDLDHRSRYGREDSRPPTGIKGREWETEYSELEWNRRLDWESHENWDSIEHKHMSEEDWRLYNRSMDSWPSEERRRWGGEWRERSRPRNDSSLESRRKEISAVGTKIEQSESKVPTTETDVNSETPTAVKRPAEEPLENAVEPKKACLKQESAPVLEDDLSEISDDADEILNRDEEILEAVTEEQPVQPEAADTTSLKDQHASTASQKSQSPPRSPNKNMAKEESIDEDNMDLDFEEISEDELEEELKVKGLGDALGVDWASLVAEFRPRNKPASSAKLRWESHNILTNLGVSVRLAGEDLVKNILQEHTEAKIQEQLEGKQNLHVKVSVKTEPQEVNMNGIKEEIMEETTEVKQELEETKEEYVDMEEIIISHPIAAIQVANREKQAIRKTLFTNVGSHRRALAARRDLTVRRHLCNLPLDDTYVEAPKRHDPELLKIATQLFERCL